MKSTNFNEYCTDTSKLRLEGYGWYYIPVSVLKITIHGAKVIANINIPIGQLSGGGGLRRLEIST